MIAGKQQLLLPVGKTHVIGGVPRGVHALYRPVAAVDDIAVPDDCVRLKVHVTALFHLYTLLQLAGAMWAIGIGGRIGMLPQQRTTRRMIHMGVGHQDV